MTESVSLAVHGVTKRYSGVMGGGAGNEVEVLAGIDLDLAGGDTLAITGPSGSGKSTLLHIIGTLDRPSSGQVTIDGVDPFVLAEPDLARFRNRRIGFVFQDHYLLPHLSVRENVLLPSLAPGAPRDHEARDLAETLLARVGLGHRLDHRPAELSGGERQRAAVARALINRPRLLLCDEPTGSLDRANADAIGDLLAELHAESRAILIVVTHSETLAGRFERQASIVAGRLAAAAAA